MVNTYAVQSGGCRFESLWGFGFFLKGAHYEVDYSGKKTYLAGLQCTLTSSCAIIGTNCRLFKKGRNDAWDELSLFGIWDELSLYGNIRHRGEAVLRKHLCRRLRTEENQK